MNNFQFINADFMDLDQTKPSCETPFISYGKRRRFCGRIRTVKCFQDNGLVKQMSFSPSSGEVLVVDGGGSRWGALMGDILASNAMKNGWVGAIIFGMIRDSVGINELDFGVKALGTNPRKSPTDYEGEIDVPVTFGEVTFTPGDYVYSDEDGIIVVKDPFDLNDLNKDAD